MQDEITKQLDLTSGAVLMTLRGGYGFDEGKFKALYSVLRRCAELWAHSASIPKPAVSLLLNLQRAIENCGYAYPGDEGERIRRESYVVGDLISKIVPWEGPPI